MKRIVLIVGGLLLMLSVAGNSARLRAIDPSDEAGRLGAASGLLLVGVLGLFMFLRGVRKPRQ